MDIWLRDADGNVSNLFGEGMYAFLEASWSPDGAKAARRSTSQQYRHDAPPDRRRLGDSRELTPHEGEVKYIPGPGRRTAPGFYLLVEEGREYSGLAF